MYSLKYSAAINQMSQNMIKRILNSFLISVLMLAQVHFAYSQTTNPATLLPNAVQTFLDKNGNPLSSGTVTTYIPNTTTKKTTWQDSGKVTAWANPLSLNAAGHPPGDVGIYGDGSYRQVVKDKNGNLIWDQVTSSTGSSGGGGSATVGDGDAVGTVKAWAGFVAPYGYVFAYGQEIVRVTYPEAFAALTSQQNVNCTSGSPTLTAVGATTQLAIGAAIESVCFPSGATIVSKTVNSVTASVNAIASTTTTARFFPFGNGDGSTTFNVPDLRGRVIAGNDIMGGIAANRLAGDGLGVNLGNSTSTLITSNLPPYTPSGSIANTVGVSIPSIPTSSSGASVGSDFNARTGVNTVTSGVTVSSAFTGTAQGGASIPVSIVQPTQTYNYIIKVIPDSNPNSFFGVASIGGMTGIITCGDGVTCAGNNISAVSLPSNVPPPSPTTLGGVFSLSCSSSNWFNSLNTSGVFGCTQPTFADIAASGTIPVSVLSPLFAANNTWTGSNTFNNLLIPGGTGTASSGSTPVFKQQVSCTRPEQYGALRDGSTDDTGPIVRAANAAFTANIGLCLTGGGSYATTAIQFGVGVSNNNGNSIGTGTAVGGISTTSLTVTSASSIDIAQGMSISGSGVTSGTVVTGFTGGTGQLGTYSISPSQTVSPGTTLTFTAPVFTASIAGTVMTVTAVTNGALRRGQNITGSGILEGTTIATLGTGTGGTGTYNLNYSQTITSETMRANAISVANIPIWIHGDSGQTSVFKAISPSGAQEKKYITIYNPTNQFSPTPPFGAQYGTFTVNANSLYTQGLVFQGFDYGTAGNITSIGSLSCGVRFIGNILTPIIYASFNDFYSRGNGGCGFEFNGLDETASYNIQAVNFLNFQAQGNTTDGFISDYANYSCIQCGSESNTGRPWRFDHVNHVQLIDTYSEANAAGPMLGTSNTIGLNVTGQTIEGIDAGLFANPLNSFNVFNGTVQSRSAGFIKPAILTVATLPTCNSTYQGSILTVSDGLSPSYGTAIVGGGTVTTSVFCRSSGSWLVLSGPNLNASQINSGTVPSANGGAGGVTGALKGNGSGIVSQAACADLSNGSASCSTDTTNATNISTGILATARGGVPQGAWSTYAPSYSTGSGSGATFTTNTARYQQVGKTVRVIVDYNCTAVGTGGGSVNISLPITAGGFRASGSGISYNTNIGRIMTVYLSASSPTIMQVLDGGPGTGVTVNSFVVELEYEIP